MSKSTINLIPPRIKKELQLKQILNVIMVSLVAFLAMTVISYGAFLATNYFLSDELSEVSAQLSEQEVKIKNLESLEVDVGTINSKLEKISTLRSESIVWSEFLDIFVASVPEKVQIESMQIDNKAKTVSISGRAQTRRDIVKLEATLNTIEQLSEISFSASVYNAEDDLYTFSMTGVVN